MGSPEPGPAASVRNWTEFLRAVAEELAAAPSYAASHRAYQSGAEAPAGVDGFASAHIAILRNATVEPWLPELYAALLRRGIKATFAVGDYSVYERYASAPSELGRTEPDFFFVYLDPAELVGDARHSPPQDLERVLLERIRGIVTGLLGRTEAGVILSNLYPDPHGVHQLHGDQDPGSWPQCRRGMNVELARRYCDEDRVAILDTDRIIGEFGTSRAFDTRMYLTARSPFSVDFLPHLARAFADIVAAEVCAPRKCVVVDCDNTLWGGVLGEDGPDGVRIGRDYPGSAYREFQLFLAGLRRRGLMLALNSKNNEADVLSFLKSSPDVILRPDDFVAHRINWRDKASNLVEMAGEINIGLDSMIFIDDSPVECERVRTALPEVQVEQFPANPVAIARFQSGLMNVGRLRVGDEDIQRTESILANTRRERLRGEAPDMESFIRSLDITLVVDCQNRSTIQRISQLTRRTNQFNLTTRRYGVGEVERLMQDGRVYCMSMKDRFSDYGIIGAAIVRFDAVGDWEIDSFMLSCRAFGRRVEDALLASLLEDARAAGAGTVRARFVATRKNEMSRDFFPGRGFEVTEESEGERSFEFAVQRVPDSAVRTMFQIQRKGLVE